MEWRPPVAWPVAQDQFVILGCRVRQTVAAVARATTARMLLATMVPCAGTVGAVVDLILGCRVRQTVATVARAMTIRMLLAAMVPWAGAVDQIKWRIKANITLVRGSAILNDFFFFLPLFSSVISLRPLLKSLEH
jgi:hypothetical protein